MKMNNSLLWALGLLFPTTTRASRRWRMVHEESFESVSIETMSRNTPWTLETYDKPFDTIMDDAGDWYKNDYGPAFTEALNSFHTYRKEFSFGESNWLTASLSARDWDKNGVLVPEPTVTLAQFGNRKALNMDIEDHTGGIILRPTNALPDNYRIEYKLLSLDFGGQRKGNIFHPDGKINGYDPEGCKTQHPWGEGSKSRGWSGDTSEPYCQWQSVRTGPYAYNGFHFMAIVDFANPAPRNNHFWHYRRKVLMDSFSQHPDRFGDGTGGQVCNANTGQYYNYRDSDSFVTLNMWVSGLPGSWSPNPGGLAGTSQRFITDCNGGKATRGVQSAGEVLTPDNWKPNEFYTFAIERNATGYTLEASGVFARVGYKKFRFFRPFEVDGEPIWHYNVKPEEYDGRHNGDLKQENWAFGSQTWRDQWPSGSAYPDYFVIGDLYTNVYEGSASITDIRLFEPDLEPSTCRKTVLLRADERIVSGTSKSIDGYFFLQANNGNLQLWSGGERLVWQTGVVESLENVSYYTILQGDSNMITWRRGPDGIETLIWESGTVNAGGSFNFVAECPGFIGDVAIYDENDAEALWSQDGESIVPPEPVSPPGQSPSEQDEGPEPDSPATQPPPDQDNGVDGMSDPASPTQQLGNDASSSEGCCINPVTLMQEGDMIYSNEARTFGQYLVYQNPNGNFMVVDNDAQGREKIMWETGEVHSTSFLYYSKLEQDGSLVTRVVDYDGESLLWKSNNTARDGYSYSLVLACCERETLAIADSNQVYTWTEDISTGISVSPGPVVETSETGQAAETAAPNNGITAIVGGEQSSSTSLETPHSLFTATSILFLLFLLSPS